MPESKPRVVIAGFSGESFDLTDVGLDLRTGRLLLDRDEVTRMAPRLDYPTLAEWCRCCALELLRSGSKFSVWFCEPCKDRARALNHAVGWAVAPIGRHSVMNGVALGGGVVPDEQQIERFAHRARGLFAQMDLIGDWAAESFRRNLVALGLDSRAELRVGEYAAAVERSRLRSIDAFDAMVTWLERRSARNGDDHRRR